MTLVFQDQYEALIWKIIEAEREPVIGIELRSEEDMQVQYALVDLNSFDQLIYEHEDIDWWSGMYAIDQDKCYFKKFTDESDPSIFELWSIDRASGVTHSEPSYEEDHEATSVFPTIYQEGTDSFQSVQTFLDSKGKSIVRSVEYLETQDHVCMTYYLQRNKSFNRYVYVMDLEGNVLLDIQIDENMKGVVFQSFFTFRNLLIFAENRNILHVYRF